MRLAFHILCAVHINAGLAKIITSGGGMHKAMGTDGGADIASGYIGMFELWFCVSGYMECTVINDPI